MSTVSRCCLACGYLNIALEDKYQEVTVCPKCNGASVDTFKLGKYKQHIKQNKECEHKYRLMDSKTTTMGNRSIHILGSFYCEKCLDTQFRGKIKEGG
ncbi:hypothetical protein [Bacillus thuringiensis]|uniref:hypothetical protein n=1 Tax=Bacillus thuringiensis TaxID=1428 RepID=UPI003015FFDE